MSKKFNMHMSEDVERKLNELRKHEPSLPNQSEMVRLLIERAFEAIKKG